MESFEWTVSDEQASLRIDKFLHTLETGWSRTQIQSWIKGGCIVVNDKEIKSNYKVNAGDKISLVMPERPDREIKAEQIPLDIRYEDKDIIIINKPRGMVVHPAPGHYSGTLVNALLFHCPELAEMEEKERPGIVHRIDKDTSGLIVVAKNEAAKESLVNQLKNREVTRLYKAIVHGVVSHQIGTIDAPIGRDKKDRQKMAVTEENSREAITHFTVLECFHDFTYLECKLETGRTHQIRVHMKYIGHPLAGDPKYGYRKKSLNINGQALHASAIGFVHPKTGEEIYLEAPLPQDMEEQLDYLKHR